MRLPKWAIPLPAEGGRPLSSCPYSAVPTQANVFTLTEVGLELGSV
jgi:hypothetical protein